jgi:hypothetical protein
MSSPDRSFNPMEAWAAVGLTMTETTLALASSMATAAVTCLPLGHAGPATSEARSAPPPRTAETRPRSASWYRPPYRSPFDPAFWLTPGHPIDHPADWMALSLAACAPGMMASAAWPPGMMTGAAWQPGWASACGPLMQTMTTLLSATSMMQPPLDRTSPANVIDFGAAYAAYRTAGGHASAQIIPAPKDQSASAPGTLETMLEAWSAMFPFARPFLGSSSPFSSR